MSLLSVEGLSKSFGGVVAARDVTFTVVREGDTLRASCSEPVAEWSLAAGERTARARAGTGFLSLELR